MQIGSKCSDLSSMIIDLDFYILYFDIYTRVNQQLYKISLNLESGDAKMAKK